MTTLSQNPGYPAADLTRIDAMRRAMRRQAFEHLAEADRLDALYAAVTGEKTTAVATISNPKPDMGEF
jgi:hypothetical protein